jgi:ABC-type maltose transport system permease subunit
VALKILLADDSMTAQNMGKKILAEAGYDVTTVSNGSAAVKKIAELHPDIMDGARLPQMLWHVVVPVMRPALATMLIINFIISWNELLYPLVFATSRVTKTLSVGLVEMATDPSMGAGRPWDLMSSLSVTMIIPVLVLVLLFQRLIISGLTRGAIK